MGRLIVIVLVAAGLWMAYWAIASTALERSLSNWIELRRADGWAADASIEVAGFPNRLDTRLTDIRVADPETGVAWSAPRVDINALSYRPNQVIVVFPQEHRLSTPLQSIDFRSETARASVHLGASTSLPLESATFVADELSLASSLGWSTDLGQLRLATDRVPIRENAHRVGAEAIDLRLPEALERRLNPTGILPERVERLRLDAEIDFAAPWDRFAIEEARPRVTAIDLGDLSMKWGDVTFQAAGALTVDDEGRPDGRIEIRAVEWRRLLDMAVATEALDPSLRDTVESGLGLLARLSGRADTLDATLTFDEGSMSIGPVPLGSAPRIVIR